MATKQLAKAAVPQLQADYIGVNNDVIQAIVSKAIAEYKIQEILKIEKMGKAEKQASFYLFKRPSKKTGFVYQAKLRDPGTRQILPTKFSTGTNDLETAIRWIQDNREKCLAKYSGKAELTILESYYSDTSKYFKYEKYDGRKMSPLALKIRQSFMNTHIVSFFQGKKIASLSKITPIHIRELKNHLLEKGLAPQTINHNMTSLKKCLMLFRDLGKTREDFSSVNFSVKGSRDAEKPREIYPIDTLKGVFSRQWENQTSKLLCMVIYFTGMRNSEIMRVRLDDIEETSGVSFLNVRGTKSKNAVRKVPVHPVLRSALESYAREKGKGKETPLFGGLYNDVFRTASFNMGKVMGHTEKQLLEKRICFYSGRHSFKTILGLAHAEKVADINKDFQEMFMGHPFDKKEMKTSEDVIKEYAYKHIKPGAIGPGLLARKGGEVFKAIGHYYL